MAHAKLHQHTQALLETPPTCLDVAYGALRGTYGADHAHAVEREMTALAQKAALVSGYMTARECGQDDAAARKNAERRLRAVRKALGFAYP